MGSAVAALIDACVPGSVHRRVSGQVAGRIDGIRPVADIIAGTVRECAEVLDRLAGR